MEEPGARIVGHHLHGLGLAREQLERVLSVVVTRVDKRVAVQVETVEVDLGDRQREVGRKRDRRIKKDREK